MWVNFTTPAARDAVDVGRQPHYVYMSNGGHTESSHGVAMLYDVTAGSLEMKFRRRDGLEWSAHADDVLPGRWYQVTHSPVLDITLLKDF